MSIASLNVIPEDFRTSVIRVYHYEDKNPSGFFYNRYYGQEIAFRQPHQTASADRRHDG